MAARRRVVPKTTVRKILKAHSQKAIGKQVDTLVFLNYLSFIEALMYNAERKAKAGGEKVIAARDIRKVTMTTLRQYRG